MQQIIRNRPINFSVKAALLALFAFGCLFLTSEAWAQEENTKKPFEKPLTEEHPPLTEAGSPATQPIQKSPVIKPIPPAKKEVPSPLPLLERESKKNESPSTLSFNLFLYIVDKFKQDLD